MKTKQTPTATEATPLHTQNEKWHINHTKLADMYSIHEGGRLITIMYAENPTVKEDAQKIIQAVNERQALLEHLENCVELLKWCGSSLTDKGKNTVKEANIFLNNAKNIQQ